LVSFLTAVNRQLIVQSRKQQGVLQENKTDDRWVARFVMQLFQQNPAHPSPCQAWKKECPEPEQYWIRENQLLAG
jgi:hypothetical protein